MGRIQYDAIEDGQNIKAHLLIVTDHSKYWMPIHHDTTEDGVMMDGHPS